MARLSRDVSTAFVTYSQVIASSNHLGNNDMLNLTTKKTLSAKMRVKSNIFAPWEEDINHEVFVTVVH